MKGKYMEIDISRYNPCADVFAWYQKQPDFKTAWETCHRGDWMLWLAAKIGINERLLVLTKGHCANTVRHLMIDKRSLAAIDAAIIYGEGKISKQKLRAVAAVAADAAAYAADAAITAYAAVAAYAAAYAAADAAADAVAAYAADAVAAYDAAAYAADAVAAAAAKKIHQLETANICRKYLTKIVFEKLKIDKA